MQLSETGGLVQLKLTDLYHPSASKDTTRVKYSCGILHGEFRVIVVLVSELSPMWARICLRCALFKSVVIATLVRAVRSL